MRHMGQSESQAWVNYPKPEEVYQHYKGGLYTVISMATDSRDDSPVVVYRSVLFGSVHVRPLSEWFEEVETKDNLNREAKTERFKKA